MSQSIVPAAAVQLNANVTPYTLIPSTGPVPPDIEEIIFANTSASPCMVTLSDGINDYYYEVPANATIIDHNIPSHGGDAAKNINPSAGWTVQCGSSVNSMYVSAIYS